MVVGLQQRGLREALGDLPLRRSTSAATWSRRLAAANDSGARPSIFSTRARAASSRSSALGASSVSRPAARRPRLEVLPAEQDLLRPGEAEQLDEARQPAVGRHEADAALAEQDARARRADPPVAGEREREAGAGHRAVDRGDDRLLEPLERLDEVGQAVRDVAVGARVVQLVEAGEVAAGAERAARAGEDDAADGGVGGRRVEGGRERVAQRRVDRVAPVGPVEREREDALGPLVSSVQPRCLTAWRR